ncbi:MAG: helix-turn-helix domain-containing protein [Nitrospirota bacterium]
MTIKDVSQYLQISENKVRFLVRHNQIPFHNNHGFLRFHRGQIDEWMGTPVHKKGIHETMKTRFLYRGTPVQDYALTASKVMAGKKSWNRLPEFIRNFSERVREIIIHDNGRAFLYRKEFSLFSSNYNDYLKAGFHLGLIGKEKGPGIEKRYYPTRFAEMLSSEEDMGKIRKIILNAILDIVNEQKETDPDERHAIILLWYFLALKDSEIEPDEHHFRKYEGELNYAPLIRLNFSKTLCSFLFDNDRQKEQEFFSEWKRLLLLRGKR